MNKDIKVLIVDDHPMIIEGYKNALLGINSDEMTLRIDTADSCDGAYAKIKNSSTGTPYDVVFLDIEKPNYAGYELYLFKWMQVTLFI